MNKLVALDDISDGVAWDLFAAAALAGYLSNKWASLKAGDAAEFAASAATALMQMRNNGAR